MTRQNVTDGPREILTDACATCAGEGVVVSTETYAVDAERRLRALVRASKSEAFLVELNAQVAGILIGPGASRLDELEKETGRRFAFKTRPRVAPSYFSVLAEGPAAEIDPQAFPVVAGQELELELEETHLHDDGDAIARLDGYVITVAGAGGSVGEKVKVRIEHAGRTSAHAVLAGEPSADGSSPPIDQGGEGEEAKPKRKTRRGSRGGRGRRKKTSSVQSVAEAPQDSTEEPTDVAEAPKDGAPETQSEAQTGATGDAVEEKPKRKTRRGTRGGRKRRKPAAKPVTEAGPEFAAQEEAG
jgi:ribonuclease G